jgi:bacterioferritin
MSTTFLEDVQKIRKKARTSMLDGAITADYSADRRRIVELLNDALATELICVLRYRRHYYMVSGLRSQIAAEEFLEHANDEMRHADMLAKRIVELNGEPDFSPQGLVERAHAEYVEGESLRTMMEEDLVAERVAIEIYRQMTQFIGDKDPTTRRLLEDILAQEEEHANELADLLERIKER